MLRRLLILRPAVHAVCHLEESLRQYLLTEEDWILLGHLKSVLEIFVKATEQLSSSLYPTLSIQLPYFIVLASRLEQLIDELRLSDPESDLLYAVNEAWSKLNDYHTRAVSAQAIATILDPRFKLQTFYNLSWKEEWIMDAKMSIDRIYNAQYTSTIKADRPATPDPFEDDDIEEAVFRSQMSTTSINAPSELEIYLEEPVEGRKVC